ncbi:AMP-binding protein, partial [Klebsiella pneumoniae]
FIEAIRRAVQIRGSETATIYLGRQRTWRQSQDRTARLAEGLRRFGLQPGCRVGILASNSDRYLEAIHAVWWM